MDVELGLSIGSVLGRIGDGVLEECGKLSRDQLNRRVDLAEANTAYQLATHIAGSTEYWVLEVVGRIPSHRDRQSEFAARGSADELRRRYRRWMAFIPTALANLDSTRLGQVVNPPDEYVRTGHLGQDLTVVDCLLHAVEHASLHLGQLQITRQLLERR